MPGISDVQKIINEIDIENKEFEGYIRENLHMRKRLEDNEKERKKRTTQKKADKQPQKTEE